MAVWCRGSVVLCQVAESLMDNGNRVCSYCMGGTREVGWLGCDN